MSDRCSTCDGGCEVWPTRREEWFAAVRTTDDLLSLEKLAAVLMGTTANAAGERASMSGAQLARAMRLGQTQARKYLYAVRDAGWLHQTLRGRQNGRRGLASKYVLTVPTAAPEVTVGEVPTAAPGPIVGGDSQLSPAHAPTVGPGVMPPLPEEVALWAAPSLAVGSAPFGPAVAAVITRWNEYDDLGDLAIAMARAAVAGTPDRKALTAAASVISNRFDFATVEEMATALLNLIYPTHEEPAA